MKFGVIEDIAARGMLDGIVFFIFEDKLTPQGKWQRLDPTLEGKFREVLEQEIFKGKQKDIAVYHPKDGQPAERLIFCGLGKQKEFDLERLRRSTANLLEKIKRSRYGKIGIVLPSLLEGSDLAQAVVEGIMLGGYEFKRYKFRSEEEYLLPEEVKFILSEGMDKQSFLHGIEKGQLYSRATILARDLVNEPASIATPQRLAEVAKDLSRSGRLKVNIYEEDAIREMGMGGLFAVSRGSEVPPRFVHILYEVPNPKKRVALVGKGITFDSGGLCIKSQESMQGMKGDMAGAAAVLGIASVLEELSPELNIHGIFPATENMPGGRAYKVGDILRILNGKTVEIVSTDAEGRLILADALSFASRQRPDVIIDIATLTGAIVVALGTDISGLFSDDEILVEKLLHASRFTGEKLWRMPVDSDYKELLKSEHADMKNSGGRDGGAILGALFLREFVEEGISWAHIDIAGAALSKGAFYKSPGATGVMVRTLLRYLESL